MAFELGGSVGKMLPASSVDLVVLYWPLDQPLYPVGQSAGRTMKSILSKTVFIQQTPVNLNPH